MLLGCRLEPGARQRMTQLEHHKGRQRSQPFVPLPLPFDKRIDPSEHCLLLHKLHLHVLLTSHNGVQPK